jgi:hypothetical protein
MKKYRFIGSQTDNMRFYSFEECFDRITSGEVSPRYNMAYTIYAEDVEHAKCEAFRKVNEDGFEWARSKPIHFEIKEVTED